MIDNLLLLSGNDIPFVSATVSIHQPTLKEIAYIGEEAFFSGCEFLNFSKENITSEDKDHLQSSSNFDIIMSIMKKEKNSDLQSKALMVLIILFPKYIVQIEENSITFLDSDNKKIGSLNNQNYNDFQKILTEMFVLKQGKEEKKYNPDGDLSRQIVDKLKKRERILNQQKYEKQKQEGNISVLSRYVSILAVGEAKDLNLLMQYTIYQLYDEFQRYQLKIKYEVYIQQISAGVKDPEKVDYWMEDIHS